MAEVNKIVIKKYPNRRLYNTASSSYITLDDLFNLIKNGDSVQVVDAKTQEDLTSATLTQVILEKEIKGYPLLPVEFLQMIIRFYEHPALASWQQALRFFVDAWQQTSLNKNASPLNMMEWANFDFAKNIQDFFTAMPNSAKQPDKKND